MAHDLLLAPEAETDVAEAYEWYEVRRRGLGEEFLSCVDAALSGILRDPDLHAIAFSNCRRVLVRRFPYAVFYEVADGLVTVYGVLHTARDSAKWRNRFP
jgi:plasmid stabilization system protein ParE